MTTATMNMEQVASSLAKQFDVTVLDQIVTAAYNPVDPNRSAANKALMQLQEAPDLWTKADEMIEKSNNAQTRFFGLQVLDDAIKTRYVMYCMWVAYTYVLICKRCDSIVVNKEAVVLRVSSGTQEQFID
jgi:hypothetical protein